MAETYQAITKDGEVESIEDVEVSWTHSEETSDLLTLRAINIQLTDLTTKIDGLTARATEIEVVKARLLETKASVTTEAGKVTLKEAESP